MNGTPFHLRYLIQSDGGEGVRVYQRKSRAWRLRRFTSCFPILLRTPKMEYRRVRRNHPKFQEDIGRHDGGEGVLIAAGFRFGKVDGMECLISKEPDIEKDMDGW